MREIITLQCGDCKNRNYTTTKNRKKHQDRLETSKFFNKGRKPTPQQEVKEQDSTFAPAVAAGLWHKIQGSRCNGRPSVSKTESGGSNPSSPASSFAGRAGGRMK